MHTIDRVLIMVLIGLALLVLVKTGETQTSNAGRVIYAVDTNGRPVPLRVDAAGALQVNDAP